ncbi:MAG: tripartite tricarboxylate transporter substrate binding protein [Aquisalimonadaceae bacterium]
MKGNIRSMMVHVPLVAGMLVAAPLAMASDYPTKPVTVVVPFPAGGSTDLMARAASREMTDFLGENVVVDNRGGGAGTVGMASLARSRADGYTIGIVPAAPLVNQPHMRETPYNLDSFEYVCQLFFSPQALAVKPDSPFENLDQLVSYARENPGELTYGTPGPGTLPHLAMEQFLRLADIEIEHLPFTGDGPGATALMGGHIDLYMTMPTVINDRDFTSLAVFSDERVDSMQGVETAIAQGYDLTAAWWGGIVAPKGTPAAITEQLSESCRYTADQERFQETLDRLGTLVQYLGPDDFRDLVRSEFEINGPILKSVFKDN